MLRAMLRSLLLVLAIGCSSPGPKTSVIVSDDALLAFADLAPFVANHIYKVEPAEGVSAGLHKYDGLLPDLTPAGIADQIKLLERDRDALLRFDTTQLTPTQRIERDVLLVELRSRLFQLVDLDVYRTNPMSYLAKINLDAYIIRDYAPAPTRAAAVIKLCTALPAFLEQARKNLVSPMPRPWLDTALLQAKGHLEFADKDVRTAFPNQADIHPALDSCKAALAEQVAWLTKQVPTGTQSFALGTATFLRMLSETQGVEMDLGRLTAIAEADLRRNLAALDEAAKAIDPKHTTKEVVAAMAADRPTSATVIALATQQTATARQFILDKQIVSIPSDELALVRETPPFQRWNSAFLDTPGPFETAKLPSFYYISPPDPTWPEAEQLAYLPPTADLLFTTIHEVYPGHFLHRLHIRKNPSKILQSFCTYSSSEGWAHYVEEMMYDAGIAGQTPQTRIGMLKEALLRNARFVATIGLHTGGMTVEQATQVFADKGFVDAGNARQQAVRGTFDPMYLAYTVGKLMFRNLRVEWMKANPGKTLKEFHDTVLSYGCAPVPAVRRAMLGQNVGAAL